MTRLDRARRTIAILRWLYKQAEKVTLWYFGIETIRIGDEPAYIMT